MEEKKRYSDEELDDELDEILEVTGFREVRQRKIKKCRVHKYLLSGGGIIDDCGYIAGRDIPIVPVYGKRWMVDGVERCMGHVRLAKDAQRLKNMQLSKLGEISALSSVEKPILTPEQVSGHEVMWAEDNVKQYPYLLINPITDANGNPTAVPPTGYTRPPAVPPALAALRTACPSTTQAYQAPQARIAASAPPGASFRTATSWCSVTSACARCTPRATPPAA